MFKKLFIASTLLLNHAAYAQTVVELKDRFQTHEFSKKSFDIVFGLPELKRMDRFERLISTLPSSKRNAITEFIQKYDGVVPEKIMLPLVYWKFVQPNSQNLEAVLKYWHANKLSVIRDYIDNPLNQNAALKLKASDLLARYKGSENINLESAFLRLNLQDEISDITPYALSALGIIPGNCIELISHNEVSPERIEWFNQRVIFAGGKLDFTQDYMRMPKDKNDPGGHPSFKDPIFAKIRDMIAESKESVFINIFLFGGTMGGTLSKYLLDQTIQKRKTNPNFKVLILHDFATNYNMLDEMMPVFEYIKSRISSEKELQGAVYLMQANIQRHPPGIPFGITNAIPKTKETFPSLEKRSTYYESKIDHSKVIVIDANTPSPQAYFGSKNWSDHSGGYYYDNALWVKGPAAAAVQFSYYDDIDAALTTSDKELPWFYFKDKGFDNKKYLTNRQAILDWFKIKKTQYPSCGSAGVRIAEANVDGRIKDVRNILVDMISKAEDHIYMEQLFIYDPYVNDALIKRKQQKPSLKVKILADHNGNFRLGGLPNTLFLDMLMKNGIEVKARRTLGIEAHFPNGKTQEYHQENHRKISSVDGKVLLAGSSNLNPDTLQGSFREFGAQIFDKFTIQNFEKSFESDWNDSSKVGPFFEGAELQLSIKGKTLSPELSSAINNLGATILKAKDSIEGK